ncbi:MAG TPA: ribonuclease HII [Candidatus Saccharimonadales bacterium]|nr:ribonuclease HII [Candidatus Saccharimonadales bacterium]
MIGVDEVGRGCLAGPILVVAARPKTQLPDGLKDSKLLSRKQRLEILNELSISCEFGEGWVKAVEIDRYGLANALRLGIKRALNGLEAQTDEEIIMDGKVNYLPKKFKKTNCLVDADNIVPIVSAASIYAKVTRDRFMTELAKKHPSYKFENHVGYGTAEHLKAIDSFGIIKFVHRTSYAPVSKLINQPG